MPSRVTFSLTCDTLPSTQLLSRNRIQTRWSFSQPCLVGLFSGDIFAEDLVLRLFLGVSVKSRAFLLDPEDELAAASSSMRKSCRSPRARAKNDKRKVLEMNPSDRTASNLLRTLSSNEGDTKRCNGMQETCFHCRQHPALGGVPHHAISDLWSHKARQKRANT